MTEPKSLDGVDVDEMLARHEREPDPGDARSALRDLAYRQLVENRVDLPGTYGIVRAAASSIKTPGPSWDAEAEAASAVQRAATYLGAGEVGSTGNGAGLTSRAVGDAHGSGNGEARSWLDFTDLLEHANAEPEVPEVGGVFYEGRRNLLSGPSEAGKSWLALGAAVEELSDGRGCLWVDTDGMGPRAIVSRLLELGASEDAIRERFLYIEPTEALTVETIEALLPILAEKSIRLVIVDSMNATLSMHGLDMNDNSDVETMWRTIADPFCKAGLAFVALDHVTKAAERSGSADAIGSERKRSGSHLNIAMKVEGDHYVSREGEGRSILTVRKDRGAYFSRPVAGVFVLTAHEGRATWRIDRVRRPGELPTWLMQAVSEYLEAEGEPRPLKTIEKEVKGRREAIREACDALVQYAFASESPGPHGSRLFAHVSPFEASVWDAEGLVPEEADE